MSYQTKNKAKSKARASTKVTNQASKHRSTAHSHGHSLVCWPVTVNGQKVYRCQANSGSDKIEDTLFNFKLVSVLILGLVWVKLLLPSGLLLPIPVGFLLGLPIATRSLVPSDRRILLGLLMASLIVGFIAPFGLYLQL